jgi:hypothetical protein
MLFSKSQKHFQLQNDLSYVFYCIIILKCYTTHFLMQFIKGYYSHLINKDGSHRFLYLHQIIAQLSIPMQAIPLKHP